MAKPLKICVCGGGKSAHVMAALAASQTELEVNVFTVYKDEAEKWSKAIANDNMVLSYKLEDDKTREVKAKPVKISKNAAEVVPESDLVIFAVAANCHEEYLKAMKGHFHKKMVIVGLPGLPGFEYLCKNYFEDLADQITIMSFEISPWICEIVEYGKKVEIIRTARNLNGSVFRGKAIPRRPALMSLQMLLGNEPALKQVRHFAELLFTTYTFFNPILVYGKWKDWDGNPMDSEPLFYEDLTASTVEVLENCSKEYQAVAHAISAKKPEVDLTVIPDIFNWLIDFYKGDIEDGTSLLKAITTNKAYKGVKHAMKKERRKFVPDFECRYLAEDVAMGMVVVRGIAELMEVQTPFCDMVIEWAQEKMKKKYIVDGKVAGSDVIHTRAPQRFGIQTVEEIILEAKIEHFEFTPIVYSNEAENTETAAIPDKNEAVNAEKEDAKSNKIEESSAQKEVEAEDKEDTKAEKKEEKTDKEDKEEMDETEEATVENKEEAKEDKEEDTEAEKKEDSKEDKKDDAKAENKEDSKEDKKGDTKAETKEDSKEDMKDDTKKKEEVKDDKKAEVKSEKKEEAESDKKEEAKSDKKEVAKSDKKEETKPSQKGLATKKEEKPVKKGGIADRLAMFGKRT